MTCECAREQDVLDAAATGRWPDRVDAELRAHVAGCAVCSDLAAVAPLFVADRDAAWDQADVPSASSVWWRTQMRVRREAAEQVTRPLVLVERAALVYAGVALFGLGVLVGPSLRASWRAAAGFVEWLAPSQELLVAIAAMAQGPVPLALLTACLLLAPVVFYLAVADR